METMSPVERVLRTMEGKPLDRVPVFCPMMETRTASEVLGKPLISGKTVMNLPGEKFVKIIAPSYPDFAPTLTGKRLSPVPRGAVKGVFNRFSSVSTDEMVSGQPMPEMPASNWMIFSGKMTETGKAIFAGSPDLKPTLPALFYIMRLI